MQISGLSASNTFSATDVLAIEINVNGVEKTYKLTGATLAAALASIGSYLKTTDVVNNLTSTNIDKPLSAAQGKALNDQIANCPIFYKTTGTATTDSSGQFTIQTGLQLSGKKVFVVSNIPKDSSNQFGVNVQYLESNGNVSFRVRKYSDGTAVGNTTIDLTLIALLIM